MTPEKAIQIVREEVFRSRRRNEPELYAACHDGMLQALDRVEHILKQDAELDTLVSPAPQLDLRNMDPRIWMKETDSEVVSPAPETEKPLTVGEVVQVENFGGVVGFQALSEILDDWEPRVRALDSEAASKLADEIDDLAGRAWLRSQVNKPAEVVAPPPPAVDLEAIKYRLAGVESRWYDHHVFSVHTVSTYAAPMTENVARNVCGPVHKNVAEFIGHAPTDIAALITEVEYLRGRLQAHAPESKK